VEESSLKMDLYRRDFTMNTLAVKLNKRDYGALVDYFGALKDVREKVIRVLHNLSFVEDPTRVLRAIRFEQRFGFKIGKLTLALMKNAVRINSFRDLSGRRLFLELKYLLMEQDPSKAIERMSEFDILKFFSPQIRVTPELRALLEEVRGVLSWFNLLYLEERYEPWKIYWLCLTSALDGETLKGLCARLQWGPQESEAFLRQRAGVIRLPDSFRRIEEEDNLNLYTLLSQYDTETLLYLMARSDSKMVKRRVSHYFTKLKGTRCALRGRDLKAMGLRPGPLYKHVFEALLEARLNGKVSTREDEIRYVRERFGDRMEPDSRTRNAGKGLNSKSA
jgi:tRNA nucleotidyltransferase (CCA-adding enzyme)